MRPRDLLSAHFPFGKVCLSSGMADGLLGRCRALGQHGCLSLGCTFKGGRWEESLHSDLGSVLALLAQLGVGGTLHEELAGWGLEHRKPLPHL